MLYYYDSDRDVMICTQQQTRLHCLAEWSSASVLRPELMMGSIKSRPQSLTMRLSYGSLTSRLVSARASHIALRGETDKACRLAIDWASSEARGIEHTAMSMRRRANLEPLVAVRLWRCTISEPGNIIDEPTDLNIKSPRTVRSAGHPIVSTIFHAAMTR